MPTPAGVLDAPDGPVGVAAPGELVALGRWQCGRQPFPAVLDPGTGQVWVYDRWARPGLDVVARQVAVVADARSLVVMPGSRCDALAVARRDGAPTLVAGRRA